MNPIYDAQQLVSFKMYLTDAEKSAATTEKYLRDVRRFFLFYPIFRGMLFSTKCIRLHTSSIYRSRAMRRQA